MEEKKVSKSVLKRLPGYLAYLKNIPENSPAHISAVGDHGQILADLHLSHSQSVGQRRGGNMGRSARIWPWSPTADAPRSAICGRL